MHHALPVQWVVSDSWIALQVYACQCGSTPIQLCIDVIQFQNFIVIQPQVLEVLQAGQPSYTAELIVGNIQYLQLR